MVQRRTGDAGIEAAIGNHSFRAIGITDYMQNGGVTPVMTPVEAAVYADATAFGRGFEALPLSRRQRLTPD